MLMVINTRYKKKSLILPISEVRSVTILIKLNPNADTGQEGKMKTNKNTVRNGEMCLFEIWWKESRWMLGRGNPRDKNWLTGLVDSETAWPSRETRKTDLTDLRQANKSKWCTNTKSFITESIPHKLIMRSSMSQQDGLFFGHWWCLDCRQVCWLLMIYWLIDWLIDCWSVQRVEPEQGKVTTPTQRQEKGKRAKKYWGVATTISMWFMCVDWVFK